MTRKGIGLGVETIGTYDTHEDNNIMKKTKHMIQVLEIPARENFGDGEIVDEQWCGRQRQRQR
jgi:hypothetical protein